MEMKVKRYYTLSDTERSEKNDSLSIKDPFFSG